MQDLPGTLQGNWFEENDPIPSIWDNQLAFIKFNEDITKEIVSVGGVITSPGGYYFTLKNSGTTNRKFSEVTPDGKVYCYEGNGKQGAKMPGKIIVEMENSTTIKVEHQSGNCSGSYKFTNPTTYNR